MFRTDVFRGVISANPPEVSPEHCQEVPFGNPVEVPFRNPVGNFSRNHPTVPRGKPLGLMGLLWGFILGILQKFPRHGSHLAP